MEQEQTSQKKEHDAAVAGQQRRYSEAETNKLVRVDIERPSLGSVRRQASLPDYPGQPRPQGHPAMQVMSEMYRQAVEAQGRGPAIPYLPFPWAGGRGAGGALLHAPGRGRAAPSGHPTLGRGRSGPPGGDSQCAACGALANFMCSACKGVHYCSTQCQRGHWEVHTRNCQPPPQGATNTQI